MVERTAEWKRPGDAMTVQSSAWAAWSGRAFYIGRDENARETTARASTWFSGATTHDAPNALASASRNGSLARVVTIADMPGRAT